MVLALIVVNLVLTLFAILIVQSHSPKHLHLLTLVLVSLAVAYPLKNALIFVDPHGSITFSHSMDPFAYVMVEIYYFVNVVACIVAAKIFMPATPPSRKLSPGIHATGWLCLVSLVLILAYRDAWFDYYTDFSLVKNEIRRRALEAQVGAGWISVLMMAGLPLTYLSLRSQANLIARAVAPLAFISVLLVVGSRAYLLGTLLLVFLATMGRSPSRMIIVLAGLAVSAAVIGRLSWDEGSLPLALPLAQRFMHTYDGFDIFAAYLQLNRGVEWGATIAEDVVVSYIPRFLWESKPFSFGSNTITTEMFPHLADTEGLMATFPSGFLLEQYANFRLAGILYGFAVFGLLAALRSNGAFPSQFVYFGAYAFAPTFFRSGASFLAVMMVLYVLARGMECADRLARDIAKIVKSGADTTR